MTDYLAIVLAMGSLILWAPLLAIWYGWVMISLIDIARLTLQELNR